MIFSVYVKGYQPSFKRLPGAVFEFDNAGVPAPPFNTPGGNNVEIFKF
jgi:hypothetical protein